MTQRQVVLHFEALQRRRRRERVETLVDVNKAFAGGKAAKAHLESLTKKP
jgi:hypothetical protein